MFSQLQLIWIQDCVDLTLKIGLVRLDAKYMKLNFHYNKSVNDRMVSLRAIDWLDDTLKIDSHENNFNLLHLLNK